MAHAQGQEDLAADLVFCGRYVRNATWTSSTTVLDNYVLGGITWAENIFPDHGLIPIGKNMHHEIVALDPSICRQTA